MKYRVVNVYRTTKGAQRFAETWDYVTTSSTIFQFYIAMDCLGTFSTFYNISLQYSIDAGVSWVDFENEDFEVNIVEFINNKYFFN